MTRLFILLENSSQTFKTVIFVKEIWEITILKDRISRKYPHFNIKFYHSDLTHEQKSLVLDIWNELEILICTTGFGTGVHLNNIAQTIHWRSTYSVLNFYQESARGGREDTSVAYLLSWEKLEGSLGNFQRTSQCRRLIISAEISQVPSLPCFGYVQEDIQFCDNCKTEQGLFFFNYHFN